MRHRNAGKQLSRNSSHRRALLRNMVTSLLKHERIETTDAKAKTLRPVAEKMITLAKRGDLHARRQALAYIQDKAVTHRLFGELKDRYLDRQGGYVRIVKKVIRKGDGAPISIVQLISPDEEKKAVKKKAKMFRKSSKTQPPRPQKESAVDKKEGLAEMTQDKTTPVTSDETPAVEENAEAGQVAASESEEGIRAEEKPQEEAAVKEEEPTEEGK